MKTHSPTTSSPVIPTLVCLLAVFFLSVMDAAMKGLVLAVGVFNAVLWRSLLVTTVAGAAWAAGPRNWPSTPILKLHLLRAIVVSIVLILFFWGLGRLPLAEAIALSFMAPLFALLLAALLLGERIRRQAIWASVGGVAGVAIIVAGQFGEGTYSPDALAGVTAILVSTVFYGLNLVLGRKQALVAKPLEIIFFQNIVVLVLLGLAAPWLAVAVPQHLWLQLAAATMLSLGGQYLMSWSYARAEAQYLIPMEYSAFIWAIAIGWFLFGEVATWPTLLGACLIIAACLIAARTNPKLAQPIEPTI